MSTTPNATITTFAEAAVVRAARRRLGQADPLMKRIISAIGPFQPDIVHHPFTALALSIVHQQLSMKAAQTITGRILALCPRKNITPTHLVKLSDDQLRTCGLSRMKVSFMRSLCDHFLSGAIKPARLRKLSDEQVIESLTDIHGVGVWTAEMILIFSLRRADVWPVDDLGLVTALKRHNELPLKPKRTQLVDLGEKYRPYRSIATWYLWRSLDPKNTPRIGP
ncbi:MAG: DNA-3-methyladenine glycosylase [Phycisphaerae bacterium]|nr:DNA-3-methyladenine glycosylase [Phycisphaerae bacterium]